MTGDRNSTVFPMQKKNSVFCAKFSIWFLLYTSVSYHESNTGHIYLLTPLQNKAQNVFDSHYKPEYCLYTLTFWFPIISPNNLLTAQCISSVFLIKVKKVLFSSPKPDF